MAEARPGFLLAGLLGRCPNCGRGPLFSGFLRVHEHCPACGEPLAEHATGALIAEVTWAWPIVWHLAVWLPLTVVLSLALLRPVKGLMLAIQYKTQARDGHEPF
jgi:uncharacterized protein (DUF983 family)